MTTQTTTDMEFGRWLKRRRQALDLTQDALAELVGCAVSTLQKIEQGARRPSRDMAERLADVLDVPSEEREGFLQLARTPARSASLAPDTPERPDPERAPTSKQRLQAPPMLLTKILPPPLRGQVVPRQRLTAHLSNARGGTVTLIVAPAGFGKTTALATWIASLPGEDAANVAWVALEEADTDVAAFLRYVVAAFQRRHPALGQAALELLETPQPPIESVVTLLINDLTSYDQPLTLVLDDYHVVRTNSIHQTLVFLIEHLPPNLRLLLVSREDPLLPTARLRARQLLHEVRAGDLRFTQDEATVFFAEAMGLALDSAEIAALEQRTEGWIAGLQLAALALRERSDQQGFIRSFTGSHRLVLDYLTEEVLSRLPSHLHTFLLQTSILDRLCGPLCDAVVLGDRDEAIGDRGEGFASAMGDTPSAHRPSPMALDSYSQLVLDQIERANLFLVPLDDERVWYRYHHLFGAVLQERLRRGAGPATITALHGRAAAWYAAQGLWQAALRHALAGQQWELGAAAVLQLGDELLTQGAFDTLRKYIEALPEAMRAAHPRLLLLHGVCALRELNVQIAGSSLEQAVAAFTATGDLAGRGEALVHLADCQRTGGDFVAARDTLQQALAAPLPPRPRLSALISRAWEALAMGEARQVVGALDEALALVEAFDDRWLRFELAINIHFPMAITTGGGARVARLAHLAQSWPAAPVSPLRAVIARLNGFTYLVRGDLQSATAEIDRARHIGERLGGIGKLSIDVDSCHAVVAAVVGDLQGADQRMAEMFTLLNQPEFADHMRSWGTTYRYYLGWLRWQQGRFDEARAILEQMEAATAPHEWPTSHCARLLLRGLLAISDGDAATETLLHAAIAEQQRFTDALGMGDARLLLAYDFLRRNRLDEALAAVKTSLEAHQERPGVPLFVGMQIAVPVLRLAVTHNVHAPLAAQILQAFPTEVGR
jgi:ATP/maltotriose-dependent transcriptional regulator MalT/DNA-binding XRE family transcriptional regulator